MIGTLDYLAPERIQDQGGDGRTDVYALGCVWATTGGYLAVFDPAGPGEPERVEGIRGPREVRFGLGAIWVTTGSNERVIAIDPETRKRVRGFDVGPLTYGLAVSDRFAWAASEGSGRLVKIAPRE